MHFNNNNNFDIDNLEKYFNINQIIEFYAVTLLQENNQDNKNNEYEDNDEVKIIRTKKFGIKPMYPEDACVQMELLGHSFFVFRNAENDEVCVVYKRKGNTYGLIEPEY